MNDDNVPRLEDWERLEEKPSTQKVKKEKVEGEKEGQLSSDVKAYIKVVEGTAEKDYEENQELSPEAS